jgi:hypothetical protein
MIRVVLGFASISTVSAVKMLNSMGQLQAQTSGRRCYSAGDDIKSSNKALAGDGIKRWNQAMSDFQNEADRLVQRIQDVNKRIEKLSDVKRADIDETFYKWTNMASKPHLDKYSQRAVLDQVEEYVRKWSDLTESSGARVFINGSDREFFSQPNLERIQRLSEELSPEITKLSPLLRDIFAFLRKVRIAYYDREISKAQREYENYFVKGNKQYHLMSGIKRVLQKMNSKNRDQQEGVYEVYSRLVSQLFAGFDYTGTFIMETNSQSWKSIFFWKPILLVFATFQHLFFIEVERPCQK